MITQIGQAAKRSAPYLAGDVLGAASLVVMFLTALNLASYL